MKARRPYTTSRKVMWRRKQINRKVVLIPVIILALVVFGFYAFTNQLLTISLEEGFQTPSPPPTSPPGTPSAIKPYLDKMYTDIAARNADRYLADSTAFAEAVRRTYGQAVWDSIYDKYWAASQAATKKQWVITKSLVDEMANYLIEVKPASP